ncbi:MAG: ABC transporter ATP-binding protein [Acidimicrobiaceae bacterium]|nr:ABC transporter ATP-binding protein [Acidimicrobiaceae bacterium]
MSEGRTEPLLAAEAVTAGYNGLPVVREVGVQVGPGETVLVIGPNGAGKSTLVKAIIGDLPLMDGSIVFKGDEVGRLPADDRAALGIGYVPQLNDVFPTLTVLENLEMGGYRLRPKVVRARIDELCEQFPQMVPLRRRLARQLSGGERKLVAIARALMPEPELLILDEPTANLSPQVANRIISEVVAGIAGSGGAVLLIEQRVTVALPVASWVNILVAGRSRHDAPAHTLDAETIAAQFFFDHNEDEVV